MPRISGLTMLGVEVLSLLRQQPMHPYEMLQTIAKYGDDKLVKVRPGSLYHCVERHVRDGFVEAVGTERDGNRPERTTYAITETGRTALRAWIGEQLAEVTNSYPPFPLALAGITALSRSEAKSLLAQRHTALNASLSDLRTSLREARNHAPPIYLIEDEYLICQLEAEVALVDSLISRISTKELTWPPR